MDKTKIAIEIFDKYANLYQEKYMDVGLYHETFDLFCDNIANKNADVLEIACGPGNITKYLLKKRPDFKITGIDLSPNMISLAKVNNPAAEFRLMDCRDIDRIDKKYDGIMCGFCLPYLTREESIKLIHNASGLLKPDGAFYLSTMEDDYSKSGLRESSSNSEDKVYIHYHQADYLAGALKENGFKIIDLRRERYPAQDGTTTTDLLIVAVRQ